MNTKNAWSVSRVNLEQTWELSVIHGQVIFSGVFVYDQGILRMSLYHALNAPHCILLRIFVVQVPIYFQWNILVSYSEPNVYNGEYWSISGNYSALRTS